MRFFSSSPSSFITMTLFTATTAFSLLRTSMAFVPSKRSFAVSSGLRRKRPPRSGESCEALAQGMKGFYYGCFMESTEIEAEPTTLGLAFPLQGKIPEEQPPRMRFAPSPTGSLHVGGARTALYNWLVAKKGQLDAPYSDAAFVLRVEDTDVARSTKESEQSVIADLKWLGLNWDEGPDMDNAPYGPYRQSERGDIYINIANVLLKDGKAYRCFCTTEELDQMKAEQEARGETPRYDGRWRDAPPELVQKMLNDNVPYTIRFKVPDNARVVIEDVVRGTVAWDAQATVGDFILLRSTGVPVYNFCVAVDDASMGITTVVRAEEHLTNTVRQALILDALGAPRPRYAHCSLILGEDKQKLSKRHGATSCDQYRKDGFLPDAMINYLALLGWNDGTDNEIFTRDELVEVFELNRVVKSPSVFDIEKLKWVNSQHIKMLSVNEVVPFVRDQLLWEGFWEPGATPDQVVDFTVAATAIAKQMMETAKDAAFNAKTVLDYNLPATFAELDDPEKKELVEEGYFYHVATKILQQFDDGSFPQPDESNLLAAFHDASGPAIEDAVPCKFTENYMVHMKQLAKETGVKGKHLFHPIRLALTGEMSGQDVTKQLSLLAMAAKPDSGIDRKSINLVTMEERMRILRSFCDSIPEEFRAPKKSENAREKTQFESREEQKQNAASQASSKAQSSMADPKDTYDGPPISALDIRVGKILKVWEHPEAEKLYCEEIDVGEGEPRQIASGLRPYMKAEDMVGRLVLVLCNLKERKLVGFPSHGMVLCASNEDHSSVRFVNPPPDAKVGERITVPDFDFESEEGQAFPENKVGKKKVFETLAPYLVTNKYGVPEFLGRPFMTSAGICTSSIPNGSVS